MLPISESPDLDETVICSSHGNVSLCINCQAIHRRVVAPHSLQVLESIPKKLLGMLFQSLCCALLQSGLQIVDNRGILPPRMPFNRASRTPQAGHPCAKVFMIMTIITLSKLSISILQEYTTSQP